MKKRAIYECVFIVAGLIAFLVLVLTGVIKDDHLELIAITLLGMHFLETIASFLFGKIRIVRHEPFPHTFYVQKRLPLSTFWKTISPKFQLRSEAEEYIEKNYKKKPEEKIEVVKTYR